MKKLYTKALCACLIASAVSSCVDDQYDLDNIDTTIKVGVNDLVVPINIDQIKMSSIFDIDENDDIKINSNGDYEYRTDGTFESKTIDIKPVFIKSPKINPSSATVNIGEIIGGAIARGTSVYIPYTITSSVSEQLTITSQDVDKSIVALTEVYANAVLSISIPLDGFKAISETVELKNFKLQFPTQLDIKESQNRGSYDPNTGVYEIDDVSYDTNKNIHIQFIISKFAIKSNEFDSEKHTINIDEIVGVVAGSSFGIPMRDDLNPATMPQTIDIKINYSLTGVDNPSGFEADAISGQIKYDIEDLDIEDIDINSLPDILSQDGTNLLFDNPRIYLHVNNPLQQYNLYAHVGFDIQALRGQDISDFPLVGGFSIGQAPNIHPNGDYNFCLSPSAQGIENADYPELIHVPYPALSDVLSGDGLPDKLKINIQNPQIPTQAISKFVLKEYAKIEGSYDLVAPLKFGAGTVICYRDTADGWYEDLEKLTIEKLSIKLNITTDMPIDINFSGYPIDQQGKQINNVTIKGAKITANAKDMPVEIEITGQINDLDGVIFEAVCQPIDNGATLNKNMTISLSNIRPRVTGYYIDKL